MKKMNLNINKTHKHDTGITGVSNVLADSSLKMEAASNSETYVNFYQIIQRSKPEDNHLHDVVTCSVANPGLDVRSLGNGILLNVPNNCITMLRYFNNNKLICRSVTYLLHYFIVIIITY
jgi:hypothetical protein